MQSGLLVVHHPAVEGKKSLPKKRKIKRDRFEGNSRLKNCEGKRGKNTAQRQVYAWNDSMKKGGKG